MWICQRCHAENRDAYSACENCGSPRTAGRFGSSPTMGEVPRSPRVVMPAAPAAQEIPQGGPAPSRRSYAPPAVIAPPPKPSPLNGFAKGIGAILLVLLPLLCGLLAFRQYDNLSIALVPLLLSEEAGELFQLLCYIGLSLIAVLLCMLPGLWTMLLAGPHNKHKKRKES